MMVVGGPGRGGGRNKARKGQKNEKDKKKEKKNAQSAVIKRESDDERWTQVPNPSPHPIFPSRGK